MYTNFFPVNVLLGDLVILNSHYSKQTQIGNEIISMIVKGPFNPQEFQDIIKKENIELDYRQKSYYETSIPRRIYAGLSEGKFIYFHQNDIIEKI